MPSAVLVTATAGFPPPLVYATQAGTVTGAVTSKAALAVTVSDQAAAKTGVS